MTERDLEERIVLPENDLEAREYVRTGRDGDDSNVLLSAAAGSGKTRILVERIVEKTSRLPEGKHIDSFAIVTFTRAAAAELMSRIEKGLSEKADRLREKGDFNAAEKITEEQYLLPKTLIGTIDSFCLDVVRKNFSAVKSCRLDPSLKPDNGFARIARKEAASKVLENYYALGAACDDGRIMRKLLTAYRIYRDDRDLVNDLIKICDFCDSLPDPETWLDNVAKRFKTEDDIRENEWYRLIKEEYCRALSDLSDHLTAVAEGIGKNRAIYKPLPEDYVHKYEGFFYSAKAAVDTEIERLKTDSEDEPALFTAGTPLSDAFRLSFTLKKSKEAEEKAAQENAKKKLDEKKDFAKKYREDSYKKIVSDFILPGGARESEDLFRKGIRETGEYVSLIVRIVKEIYHETLNECALKNSFSFSAIAHFALEILCEEGSLIGNDTPETLVPSEVAKAYRRKLDEIYVDEYQDTSMLQEFILYQVSGIGDGRNNMIMVGDIKQSIYSFRNAKPKLMLTKTRDYSMDRGGVLKLLSSNFRSRRAIIDGTNEIFSKIMTAEAADIDYEKGGHRLSYGAEKKYESIPVTGDPHNGRCELIFCAAGGVEGEAAAVAAKIKELMNGFLVQTVLRDENGNPVRDEEGNEISAQRPLKLKDICVLAGKNKQLDDIGAYFKKEGLDSETRGAEFFFERSEIYDILSFIRVIDNPINDIPLAGLLKSDFFGFSDNELAEVKALSLKIRGGKSDCFWDSLRDAFRDENKDSCETAVKAQKAAESINGLRRIAETIPVSGFVWKLINFNDYYKNCDGTAKGNLRIFLDYSYPFDRGVNGGFYGFVKNMEKIAAMDAGLGSFERQRGYVSATETTDKIRLMTVHGSKGLEFPVVFYMCTNKDFPSGEETVCCDEDYGIGLNFQHDDGGLFKKISQAAPTCFMKLRKSREARKEYQRLVYVALTRAKEKLFVVASKTGNEKTERYTGFVEGSPGREITTAAIKNCSRAFQLIWLGITAPGSVWDKTFLSADQVGTMLASDAAADAENTDEANETDETDGALTALESVPDTDRSGSPAMIEDEKTPEKREEPSEGGDVGNSCDAELERLTEALEIANGGVMPIKISVSALKRYVSEEEGAGEEAGVFTAEAREFPKKFGSAKSRKIRGADLGTLMHKIMKRVVEDRQNWPSGDAEEAKAYAEKLLEELLKDNIIDADEFGAADRSMIVNFLISPRGREVRMADKVRCEVPFTYMVPAGKYGGPGGKEALPEEEKEGGEPYFKTSLKESKTIALQGVIDLYYKIGTRVVVVDFKTDNEEAAENPKTRSAYLLQIRCYRDALQDVSAEKTEESLLFFLRNGKELRLED